MKPNFHTNLDEAKPYVLDLNGTWCGPLPRVGEEIEFKHSATFRFSLRVVAVRYNELGEPRTELHVPPIYGSILDWMEWFQRNTRGY